MTAAFRVTVRIHGHVREFFPQARDGLTLSLTDPVPLRYVLSRARINPDVFTAIFVNGQKKDLDYVIDREADVLLLSPMAGG